ncbi:MAG: protein-disulfide reductase DsbD family protein [Pseudohaliea sp.]
MRAPLIALLLFFATAIQALGQAPGPLTGGAPQAGSPFASLEQGFLPVEEAYVPALELEDDGRLRLYWQIAPAYYLYRHQFAFDLSDARGEVPVEAALPPALERTDEFFGEVAVYYDNADITLSPVRPLEGTATLQVRSQGCADAGLCYPPRDQAFRIDTATGAVSEVALPRPGQTAPVTPPAGAAAGGAGGLLTMLLFAALGGLILNLMPCVFPVLSLKALGFAAAEPAERHRHAWLYGAGVVVSFLVVAGALIALRGAGMAVGWGFQLQSPGFVIGLAYLFVAMGLSLSGLVHFGGRFMNLGNSLASDGGDRGAFFTGALAVVVASPCTAPFMGTALGFALTQPAAVGLAVFAALGAGMAAPMVLLGHSAIARRLLPRPGAWMQRLQQLLAFPLYATALWLFWVAGRQAGVDTMAAALGGALLLALALWLWSTGGWRRGAALLTLAAAILAGSYRGEAPAAGGAAEGHAPWSEAAVREAQAAGTPVFVDFTADWCITCLANERTVLETDTIRAAFAERGVRYLVADWTNRDPAIADFLARQGRSGIPLYLLYPGRPGAAPAVLPQLLRKGVVLEALAGLSST